MGYLGRIFGGGLGWAIAGPIGGLIGWWLGSRLDEEEEQQRETLKSPQESKPGDFAVALMVIFAKVLKADGRVLKSELEYVKSFLLHNFSYEDAREMLHLLKNLLEQDYYIYEVADQINQHLSEPEKLQLIHVLFGLSQADGEVHPKEVEVIEEVARYLHIPEQSFQSIKAMFAPNTDRWYEILGVSPAASNEEIKKAYHRLAAQYHPDKVQHLGPEFTQLAEQKFKAINEAYQHVRAQRGF